MARRLGSQGRVYLLVQPSVSQEKNKSQHEEDDEVEYVKEIEEALRRWIDTEGCRRDIQDEYFNNPLDRECTPSFYHFMLHN